LKEGLTVNGSGQQRRRRRSHRDGAALASRDLSVDVPIGDDDEATLPHLPDHK
jgi:hypothetical protein